MTKFDINSTLLNKEHIVFDFDNTLVNSLTYWYKTLTKDIFKYFKIKGDERINELFYVHMKNIEKAHKIVQMYDLKISDQEMLDIWHSIMEKYYQTKVKLLKGAKKFLLLLKKQGKKIYIASATDHNLVKRTLQKLDIDLFDFVFSEDILGYPKSQKECFESLISKLDTTADKILFFEDSLSSTKSATSIQIECICPIHRHNKKNKSEFNDLALTTIKNYTKFNKQIEKAN